MGASGFLLVVLLVLALVAGGCSGDVNLKPPKPPRDETSQRADAAQTTLDGLVAALDHRSVPAARVLAAAGAADRLGVVATNASALDLTGISMRYVDEGTPLGAGKRAALGPGAWIGLVEVQYAFGGVDATKSRVETPVVFVPDGAHVRIASFGASGERTPLWLATRLAVVRGPRTLTAVAAPTAGRFPGLVRHAVTQVRRTLPAWHGPLVVEVAQSQDQLDAAVQAAPGEYDDIAAVTTTEDGSLVAGTPVRVFVNPGVFGKLADRGAQVVMSHEATHVATGATFVDMPTWLLEGFADFVALDRAGVPVSLAARQILARIRKNGLPDRLPTSADLNPTANGLGATYEEAWLACRFAAQKYGKPKLIAFYRSVSGGAPQGAAFRRVLGTSERGFVRAWRSDLSRLAGLPGNA